mmetsp:Transcript_8522/g.14363  ORF Transcript_8522/g.14363 Transcript_8522/m.14363 type:complete len:227 (+) Transcript_8522:30-710(+)
MIAGDSVFVNLQVGVLLDNLELGARVLAELVSDGVVLVEVHVLLAAEGVLALIDAGVALHHVVDLQRVRLGRVVVQELLEPPLLVAALVLVLYVRVLHGLAKFLESRAAADVVVRIHESHGLLGRYFSRGVGLRDALVAHVHGPLVGVARVGLVDLEGLGQAIAIPHALVRLLVNGGNLGVADALGGVGGRDGEVGEVGVLAVGDDADVLLQLLDLGLVDLDLLAL